MLEEVMRYPIECYQMLATIEHHFPDLRASQQRGLVLWVYGVILSKSATQSAVIAALSTLGAFYTLRQYLREWLLDGPDKATPCHTQLEVTRCFAPLLRWLLSLWQCRELALTIDAHRPWGADGSSGHQRALPRQRYSLGLADPARQPPWPLDAPHPWAGADPGS